MFGVGMVIAGGCISGATYRTGEGMVGSMLALGSIAVGAAVTISYPLAPIKNLLQTATKIQINGLSPTISLALGVSPWFIIIPVFALFVLFARRRSSLIQLRRQQGEAHHLLCQEDTLESLPHL